MLNTKVVNIKEEKKAAKIKLPKEIFGGDVNKSLLAQAVRVYQFNKRQGTVKTKTRGEVKGSRKKIWRQKGTGRARHGDRYAPIFVGGGVAHGPQPKDWSRKLSKKMKRKALFSALSARMKLGEIEVVDGLESLAPKTKIFMQNLRDKLKFNPDKEKILLITHNGSLKAWRGIRNIQNLTILEARLLNAYEALKYKRLIFTKKAIEELKKVFLRNNG